MPDSFILRFRDITEDDTIDSHSSLISSAGYVWWGWWKKESEPNRYRDLEEIRGRASETPIQAGLFDRSTHAFYAATVNACVFSDGLMPSPEPRKTPSYYSDERLPAWFKLASIEELDEEAFVERFVLPPTGEETFFPVRRDQQSARGSTDSVQLDTPCLLHISDLHFGADYGFPSETQPAETTLLDVIARDFRDEKPGLVVLSGDITTRADANVLQDDALCFLTDLADTLDIPRECFIIVPGNHDIALKSFKPQNYSHEASFHLFRKEFHQRESVYPELRSFVLPNGRKIEILAINSVRLRRISEKNFGYVQWPLYEDLLRTLPHDPDTLRIAVLHHHLVPALREEGINSDYPEASVSVTLDAGAVIEGLQRHGFELVLHGHQHVPAAARIARGSSINGEMNLADLHGIVVLAAGSAGASRLSDEMRDNSYNVIKLGERGFEAEARRYNKGSPPQRHFQFRGL